MRLELDVLGAPRLTVDGVVVGIGSMLQQRLLGVLACHANADVSRDRLIDALWDDPPALVEENLRVHVYRLRRALGDANRIVRRRPFYRLVVRQGELDAERFQALADQAGAALGAGEAGRAEQFLVRALGLWRGPAYHGLAELPLIRQAAARLEESRLSATEQKIEAGLLLGRHRALLPELAALVLAHPLRERLRGQQMVALYRSGRQSEALDVYQRGRRLLAGELGLEPGPALRRLQEAILRGDPALER